MCKYSKFFNMFSLIRKENRFSLTYRLPWRRSPSGDGVGDRLSRYIAKKRDGLWRALKNPSS